MKSIKKLHIVPLTDEERIKLLQRNIWKKKECCAYFGVQPPLMRKAYKLMKEVPDFPNRIYGDEILAVFGTTREKELAMYKLTGYKIDDE